MPASTLTYTFATWVLSGTLSGWTQSVPSGTNPIYIITATAVSSGLTDTIATGEWSTPQILAQNGVPGSNGAPGVDALDLAAVPNFIPILTNAIGVVEASELPRPVQFNAKDGVTDVTALAVWTLGTVDGCAVANSGGGLFSVTNVSADKGGFEVTATHAGKSAKRKVTYAKAKAGTAAQRSAIGPLGTPGTVNAPAIGVISLNIMPGVTVTMSMLANYNKVSGAGSARIESQLMYRNATDSGAWTQAGTTVVGSESTSTGGTEPVIVPGSVNGSRPVPAPASVKVFEFRVDWVRIGGDISVAGSSLEVAIT